MPLSFRTLICAVTVAIIPGYGTCSADGQLDEKRIEVVMRMIGHEVLNSLGDSTSRVMPIEKIEQRFKVSFASEFAFDPDDIISIVECAIEGTGIDNCLVELEQCDSREIVHSFFVGPKYEDMTPCRGREMPRACYNLLVTIKDGQQELSTADPFRPRTPLHAVMFIVPVLLLVGGVSYMIARNRIQEDPNPNILLIGETQFDYRKMVLTYANESVELSNKESELLLLLNASANTPIERDTILNKVWGDEGDYVGRTLDVFISKLRKKLEPDTSVKIVNIRGVGYKLVTGL